MLRAEWFMDKNAVGGRQKGNRKSCSCLLKMETYRWRVRAKIEFFLWAASECAVNVAFYFRSIHSFASSSTGMMAFSSNIVTSNWCRERERVWNNFLLWSLLHCSTGDMWIGGSMDYDGSAHVANEFFSHGIDILTAAKNVSLAWA